MIRPSTLIKHSPDRTPGRVGWEKSAACVDHDPELFFIHGTGDAWERDANAIQRAFAKAVCASCPVQAECLAAAYESGDKDSIRGGLTPTEREGLKRAAKRKSRAGASPRTTTDELILCDSCDREFTSASTLRFHMASHAPTCVNGHDVTAPDARSHRGYCRQCRREREANRRSVKRKAS